MRSATLDDQTIADLLDVVRDAPHALVVADRAGRVLACSAAARSLWGAPIERQNLLAYVAADLRPVLTDLLGSDSAQPRQLACEIMRATGATLAVTIDFGQVQLGEQVVNRLLISAVPHAQRREQLLVSFSRIATSFMTAGSVDAVMRCVTDGLSAIGVTITLVLHEPEAGLRVAADTTSPAIDRMLRRLSGETITAQTIALSSQMFATAATAPHPVFMAGFAPDRWLHAPPDAIAAVLERARQLSGIEGYIVAPIRDTERICGLMVMRSTMLVADDGAFVEAFAAQLGVSLTQIALRQANETEIRRLNMLSSTVHAVTALGTFDDMLRTVCEQAVRLFGADHAAVALPHEHDTMIVAMVSGEASHLVGSIFPIADSLIGIVLRTNRGYLVHDLHTDRRPHRSTVSKHALHGAMMQPLRHRGEIIGTLTVAHALAGFFSAADLLLLEPYADIAATTVANARLHNALMRAEQRHRLLVDLAADAVVICAVNGLILRVNAACCRMMGWAAAELEGQHFGAVLAPTAREDTVQQFRNLLDRKAFDGPLITTLLRGDGREILIEFAGQLIAIDETHVEIELIGRDVTDRVHREAEQRSRERELATLLKLSETVALQLDIGAILDAVFQQIADLGLASTAFVRMVNRSGLVKRAAFNAPAAVTGAVARPFFSTHEQTALDERRVVVLDVQDFAIIATVYPEIGELGLQYGLLVPINHQGQVVGLLEAGRTDLDPYTAQEIRVIQTIAGYLGQAIASAEASAALADTARANQQLYQHTEAIRRYLDALIQSAPDLLLVCRPDLTFRVLNPSLLAIQGYRVPETPEPSLLELVPVGAQVELRLRLASVFAGATERFEIDMVRGNATLFRALIAAEFIPDYQEALLIVKDVTKERALESQLRQSEKQAALVRMVAGTTHELNNPLAIILGLAQLNLAYPLPDELRSDIEEIERAARRAGTILQHMRLLSRPKPVEPRPIDVAALFEDTLARLAAEIASAQVVVRTFVAERLPVLNGDLSQIEQAMYNLVLNAVQSMAVSRPDTLRLLTIEARPVVGALQLRIADTGGGLTPEAAAHLFEPFFSTHSPGEQLGLGLAIAHAIVQQHNGTIVAEPRFGNGALFVIELPIHEPMRLAIDPPATFALRAAGRRVLVCESDGEMRTMLARAVGLLGCDVDSGEQMADVVHLLTTHTYQMVVGDVWIRLDDGVLARALRDRYPQQRWLLCGIDAAVWQHVEPLLSNLADIRTIGWPNAIDDLLLQMYYLLTEDDT